MAHSWRAIRMRHLRTALLSISPLLTDLIRHALIDRVPITVVAKLADSRDLELAASKIDVVLLGSPGLLDVVKAAVNAEILVLSDDLRELCWPATCRSMPLSVENLVSTLRRIADDLDLRPRSNPDP